MYVLNSIKGLKYLKSDIYELNLAFILKIYFQSFFLTTL